jgi:hypothetical protein
VWRNCPKANHGTYSGKEGKPTLVAEALFDDDLTCWHCAFGSPGTCNDITVLESNKLYARLVSGNQPKLRPYTLGGIIMDEGYYAVDGIYPRLSCFWKTVSAPVSQAEKTFSGKQESVRKAAERGFGVMFAQWQILDRPVRLWFQEEIFDVVYACVILHNF